MTLIKSISGIRGTIGGRPGDNLTPLDIVKFTTAYVRFLGERKQGRLRIVVGRDARLSGEMVGVWSWPSRPTRPTAASSLPPRTIRANGTR